MSVNNPIVKHYHQFSENFRDEARKILGYRGDKGDLGHREVVARLRGDGGRPRRARRGRAARPALTSPDFSFLVHCNQIVDAMNLERSDFQM